MSEIIWGNARTDWVMDMRLLSLSLGVSAGSCEEGIRLSLLLLRAISSGAWAARRPRPPAPPPPSYTYPDVVG